MQVLENENLAKYTSFGVGGNAEKLIVIEDAKELDELNLCDQPLWILGSGTNTLISDEGLKGITLLFKTNKIDIQNNTIISDAGVLWDDLVVKAIENDLWGLELTSGIPGTVGAGVAGNIAAYGQAVSDCLSKVLLFNKVTRNKSEVRAEDLELSYRFSKFKKAEFKDEIILRATFNLNSNTKSDLEYESAKRVAKELGLVPNTLENRRQIILEARKRAGSMVNNNDNHKTAGSFFKNPTVTKEVADYVLSFDESGATKEQLKKQNTVHGGDNVRVSAAHVLLACGFKRGQSWGEVELHPDHILKISNKGGAKAQEIYNVSQMIISTVKEKIGIELEPEIEFLGNF